MWARAHRRSWLVSVGELVCCRKDHKWLRVVCVGTVLIFRYIFECEAVPKEHIAMFSLVMRLDKLGILDFFESLHFWTNDGVCRVRIHWFGIYSGFNMWLSLFRTALKACAGFGPEDFSSEYIWNFLGEMWGIKPFGIFVFIGKCLPGLLIQFAFWLQLRLSLGVILHQWDLLADLLLMEDVVCGLAFRSFVLHHKGNTGSPDRPRAVE